MVIAAQDGSEVGGFFAAERARSRAEALLVVLAARGIDVPDQERDRIANCLDIAQLDEWVTRAVTAMSIKDLFD